MIVDGVGDAVRLARLADNCNVDRRFIEKHWVESAETIRELMRTDAFRDSLKSLQRGIPPSEGDHVAALFHARQEASRRRTAKPVT